MKLLATVALFLTLTCSLFAVAPEKKAEQHKAMHMIEMMGSDDIDYCTAYAIDKHVLLTAQHCDLPGAAIVLFDDSPTPHMIYDRIRDGNDHLLLVFKDAIFPDTVEYDPSTYKPAVQGEHVYTWGNPGGERDMYREGYVMGVITFDKAEPGMPKPGTPCTVLDFYVIEGDSGSAVFSETDGRLVGVVTFGFDHHQSMGMFPLVFTKDQVNKAEHEV